MIRKKLFFARVPSIIGSMNTPPKTAKCFNDTFKAPLSRFSGKIGKFSARNAGSHEIINQEVEGNLVKTVDFLPVGL